MSRRALNSQHAFVPKSRTKGGVAPPGFRSLHNVAANRTLKVRPPHQAAGHMYVPVSSSLYTGNSSHYHMVPNLALKIFRAG